MSDGSAMRAVVEVVARALVDRPDDVQVTESVRRGMTVVELTTAPSDMGKIIGRQGRTAAALRTLVSLAAEQSGTRGQLDIRDQRGRALTVPAWDELVLVGRVARPHGIRGQVVVNPETDFVAERFFAGAQMWTRVQGRDTALTIADARVEGPRPILTFDGYASVEAAESLAGAELRVPESELRALPAGSYYLHQLAGCRVETVEGGVVGTVRRVDGGAGTAVLVVDGSRGEVLIPFVQEMCVGIDAGARLIRVRLPEGLLELNEIKASKRTRRQPDRKT